MEKSLQNANVLSSDITSKLILAPMVRICTTPFRLLSLKYGADIVFTEEIIAKKLMNCIKIHNKELNTTEYISIRDGSLALRVHPEEMGKLVLQIGASDPEDAVKAALVAKDDIIGVDVNMGCPKHFSTHGNMGSALLLQPDLAKQKSIAKIPFNANGDILSPFDIYYLKRHNVCNGFMIARGAIHNPRIFEEYKNLTHDEFELLCGDDLNLLENDYEEIQDEEENKFKSCSNKSEKVDTNNEDDLRVSNKLSKIFEKKYINRSTDIDIVTILKDFIEFAMKTGNAFNNSKYNALYILKTHKKHLDLFKKIQNTKNYKELSELLEIEDKYDYYSKLNENMSRFWDNSYYRDMFKKRKNN